jgi:hypothetical protein
VHEKRQNLNERLFGDGEQHAVGDPCAEGKGDCSEVKNNASDLIDDEIDPGMITRIRHHLGLCTNCDSWLRSLAETVGLVQELPQQKPSDSLMDRIRSIPRE